MADLVRNDVGLGEIAAGAEAVLQFVEKLSIEIELAVSGTIERARRG